LEHGGSSILETNNDGETVWDKLIRFGGFSDRDDTTVIALLRVMVLQGAPPVDLIEKLPPELARVVSQGKLLRTLLPAYLANRRTLLDAHTPLIAPLRALVSEYEEPTTTDELWATRIVADSVSWTEPITSNTPPCSPSCLCQ
jgi:hypothetical protein